jgi:hypothetical protein
MSSKKDVPDMNKSMLDTSTPSTPKKIPLTPKLRTPAAAAAAPPSPSVAGIKIDKK